MKICICLPSYNESENIQNITKIIDEQLVKMNINDIVLLNVDNSSKDKTSEFFLSTNTKCNKKVLLTKKIGKGFNIYEFIKYCQVNNVDKAIMLDSDLYSINKDFIKNMITSLDNFDFIIPNYKRSRFEGNVTNHFVYPMILLKYNKNIRQPIAGDYAFNKKYLNSINLKLLKKDKHILKYGIDLFLVDYALKNNYDIGFVYGGEKKHAPSYMRTTKIFLDVFKTWKCLNKKVKAIELVNFENSSFCSVIDENYCNFLDYMIEKNKKYICKHKLDILNYDNIRELWITELCRNLIKKRVNYKKFQNIYSCFLLAYWLEYKSKDKTECERELLNNAKNIKERLELWKKYV